jgi:signal transduction histidine kinase
MVGDMASAALLALLTVTGAGAPYAHHHPLWYWLVGVLMVAPIAVRRRWPSQSAYVILAGGVLQMLTHGSVPGADSLAARASDLALAIALYTLVVYTDRRAALTYAGLLVASTGIDLAWRVDDRTDELALGIGGAAIYGLAWVLGEFVGARRAYHTELEARLKLLETERDQQATIAVAAERTRIARELHDVVAHAVSVIVVQADGAGYAIRGDPELAEAAVRTISETGREALMELRRLLDVLRSDTDEPGDRSPQPGVTGLPELAEKFRSVGLPVELNIRGEVTDLPATVGLGVYRIVQEALTNAFKHAGFGAATHVRVERVGGLVEVEVTDSGGEGGAQRRLASVSGGNGLIGMRERATVLGGTLTTGWADGGGWRVRATFPVRAPHDASPHTVVRH